MEKKIITPGKTVPYKRCLPSWNISMKTELTRTFFLTNATHFQLLSVTFIKYEQNVNKQDIS